MRVFCSCCVVQALDGGALLLDGPIHMDGCHEGDLMDADDATTPGTF
jgi:hypothetical protein